MIIEALVGSVLASNIYHANKSLDMDERALKKYAKAFEKSEEAAGLIRKKAEYMDKRLANVARKKRSIINNTVPKFVEVYGQIQKVEIESKSKDLSICHNAQNLTLFYSPALSMKKDFTDKELVCGCLIHGLGKMMEKESERYLSAANNQMRAANVAYSQAESILTVYDAIIQRADRIAKLLVEMNVLFLGSIEQTGLTIRKNGYDVRNYSEYDKGVLMTCVNMAAALSDLIDIPVVDENGKLCENALALIQTGEEYINKMNSMMRED